ncbi:MULTISPECIES: hypothetical protein [Chryseobacterium]|jgi:hypothetical protein|uniref:hypothetical protein n=1 Tax=Chryseobacterium TaxID=59732 RepID=UPI00195C7457|nr:MULTISPECIES: hypothetical protein [Chryseobacterium]MBM7421156.1 hypothetical protein [Chryseobacterium sp. JUb44]MDH6211116.1 hypothetical protein [Chryseobacterium sp. BIGb0186]WSO09779.1 hypothetical protein VUJ64_18345 [Chryseobacterium scophthalmum]
MFFPIIFLILFWGVWLIIAQQKSQSVKGLKAQLFRNNTKVTKQLQNVKCFTFATGRRRENFRFNRADLVMTDDALFIFGFYKLAKLKFYQCLIILTDQKEYYTQHFESATIPVLIKFNLNSFNNDVYIEFGKSDSLYENIEIRLENLSAEDKNYIYLK